MNFIQNILNGKNSNKSNKRNSVIYQQNNSFTSGNSNVSIVRNNGTININGSIINNRYYNTSASMNSFTEKEEINSKGNNLYIKTDSAEIVFHFNDTVDKITAELTGMKDENSDTKLTLETKKNCVNIITELSGQFQYLVLNIYIPNKTYNNISIETASADININKEIKSNEFNLETKSGDITVDTSASDISLDSMSGDVKINLEATSNTTINATTMSGDVKINLSYVKNLIDRLTTMSGDINNYYKTDIDGYSATIKAKTMSGDIKIQ